MGEEVEKHILRKYEILQKLGKGVRFQYIVFWHAHVSRISSCNHRLLTGASHVYLFLVRRMELFGKPSISVHAKSWH